NILPKPTPPQASPAGAASSIPLDPPPGLTGKESGIPATMLVDFALPGHDAIDSRSPQPRAQKSCQQCQIDRKGVSFGFGYTESGMGLARLTHEQCDTFPCPRCQWRELPCIDADPRKFEFIYGTWLSLPLTAVLV